MQRRQLTTALALAAALTFTGSHAQTTDWPNQPVTLIVPYAAGGTTDLLGRALAQSLAKQWGQPVVVENKPGAGGTLGVVDMRRTKPDGYRLTLVPVSIFRQPHIQKVPFDPMNDLTYVASFMTYDFILNVAHDSPFQTLKDLVEHAKKHPNEINYGSPGKFTGNHVAMALLAKAANVKLTHVPYKGDSEATPALLGGHVQAMVSTNSILNLINAGKVRALAVAAETRPPAFANVPTFREAGYDVIVPSPLGVGGPKGLPAPVVQKLETSIAAALQDPDMQRIIETNGVRPDYRDSAAYTAFAKQSFAEEKDIVQALDLDD